MTKSDFHVHTSASDGLLSPSDIVLRAYNNGVKYLAITDHDTLSGLYEALSASLKYNITLIPGIELSTIHNGESVHILGYFKGDIYKNEKLIGELDRIKNHRIERAKEIISKLKSEFNININMDDVQKKSADTVARPHIARAIIDSGYDYEFEEIFEKFIGKDCKAYVPTLKITTEEGINLLKRYNALVFLAHPKLINNTPIDEFLNMPFDGIEAVYFQNTPSETEFFIKQALEHNLLISCGSDFHGDIDNDPRHGDVGSMSLDDKYLNKILCALDKH